MSAFAFIPGKRKDEEKTAYSRRDLEKGGNVHEDTTSRRSAKKLNQQWNNAVPSTVYFTPKVEQWNNLTLMQEENAAGILNF